MADPAGKLQRAQIGKVALVLVPLLVMLGAAIWYAFTGFNAEGPPMPVAFDVAMVLGVVFSLVIGCGLMALLFYSSRHGYDEPHRADDERE